SEVSPRSCSDVRRKVRLHLLTVLASLGLLSFAEDVGPESEIQDEEEEEEEEYEEKEEEKEEEENAALRRHAAPRTRQAHAATTSAWTSGNAVDRSALKDRDFSMAQSVRCRPVPGRQQLSALNAPTRRPFSLEGSRLVDGAAFDASQVRAASSFQCRTPALASPRRADAARQPAVLERRGGLLQFGRRRVWRPPRLASVQNERLKLWP
ncbi:unnamed protein product, partial [Prorocentrum cordatum]